MLSTYEQPNVQHKVILNFKRQNVVPGSVLFHNTWETKTRGLIIKFWTAGSWTQLMESWIP